MENNKGQTIFLSVIGIATLLVAIVGATFAWFSTTISGDGASGQVTTATVGAITLTSTNIATDVNVLPGWTSGDGSIRVSGTLTGNATVDYSCTVVAAPAADLPDLQYRIGTVDTADSTTGTWTNIAGSGNIATGTLSAGNPFDEYFVAIKFPETASDQNLQQTKTVTATFTCALTGGNVYYNTNNPGGTTQQPNEAY